MVISLIYFFCPPKEVTRKGGRNRAEGELGEAKSQPHTFLPKWRKPTRAKKCAVRTFSGFAHALIRISVFL
jgi:hypothetical protein